LASVHYGTSNCDASDLRFISGAVYYGPSLCEVSTTAYLHEDVLQVPSIPPEKFCDRTSKQNTVPSLPVQHSQAFRCPKLINRCSCSNIVK